jgi:NADH:ubiquinone oxidoreductase subunit F (NADH-binding)
MFPCREGTGWMEKILLNIENGKGKMSDIDLLWDIQRKIEGNTICPLGDAAAWPVAAAIRLKVTIDNITIDVEPGYYYIYMLPERSEGM